MSCDGCKYKGTKTCGRISDCMHSCYTPKKACSTCKHAKTCAFYKAFPDIAIHYALSCDHWEER